MAIISIPFKRKKKILSLGAESAGRFCFYSRGNIFVSDNFGDLLEGKNFDKYKSSVLQYVRNEKPDVILTDLHPLYNSTVFGEELSKKFKVPHIKVQHHVAHIFSAVGDRFLQAANYKLPADFFGIAMDGTGYGFDGNIWGGEVFKIQFPNRSKITISKSRKKNSDSIDIERIGSLEEQTMIGGDLAVKEPMRMIIAILAKSKNQNPKTKTANQSPKIIKSEKDIYKFVKKYYTRNEFEVLYNQLKQNFNCQITTSTGRILDAVSVFLGFAGNERKIKHEAAMLLEKNSTVPYAECKLKIENNESRKILNTTQLFEYFLENSNNDKKRLAATAQLYLAKGLFEIVKNHDSGFVINDSCFAAGGMANNKIISSFLESRGVYLSKKIPRGDEGMAFGQIIYYLFQR